MSDRLAPVAHTVSCPPCAGAVTAWDIGKIHRDIKPGNIMRRTAGGYVLLDAGPAFQHGHCSHCG